MARQRKHYAREYQWIDRELGRWFGEQKKRIMEETGIDIAKSDISHRLVEDILKPKKVVLRLPDISFDIPTNFERKRKK